MGNLTVDTSAASVSLSALLVNLTVCALLAFVMSWHFGRFGSTFSNRSKFGRVLPPIAMTTMLVIMVVKSNLILSLGLVGALSIVRFRTPVKEPEELAYLFLAIALGLGMGAEPKGLTVLPPGPREVTAVSILAILAILAVRSGLSRSARYPNLFLNLDVPSADGSGELSRKLLEVVARHTERADLRRLDTQDNRTQVSFYVDCRDADRVIALETELRGLHAGTMVTFVEQSGLPGT